MSQFLQVKYIIEFPGVTVFLPNFSPLILDHLRSQEHCQAAVVLILPWLTITFLKFEAPQADTL